MILQEKKEKVIESFSIFLSIYDYVGEGSAKKDLDDKNKQDQGEEKLDKETSEKMNKLAEEFKNVEIKFPKKPDPSKGEVSKPSQVLGALNSKLEEKFGEEMQKSAEDDQPPGEETTPGEANKIETSAEGGAQETPFGKLSDVVANVAAFISGKDPSSDSDDSSYLDSEEREAKELEKKEYTSSKISTYLGLNPDDPDIAKKEVENKKSQKSKPDSETAKIYDSFPNGGVNRENQEELSRNNMERMKKNKALAEGVKNIEKYPLPKYDSLSGDKAFYGSAEYNLVCEELGIGEKDGGSKFFKKLKSLGLGSKIVKLSEGPFIIFVRPPLAVKNKYGNSFSDIAFLVTREDDKLNVFPMMASSTPSPAFMNIEWRNSIAAKIGLRGINFQGTFMIKSSILPSFKLEEASEKSKFYSSKILTCSGPLSKLLGSLPNTPPDGCKITKYDPSYTPPVVGAKVRPSICPSLPKGTSQFLDATTSGDLVIQDFEDYQELVNKVSASGGSVGVIILNG